ncbi:hypothetical protein PHMEG_00040887 [Phytophthora megakarya]|uniref:Uncharacterized protein n=1 Tax=Phytophthora megakarya TaxID=4795 RepID=A0A225UCH7_9STRA|nr:hypothetical protein PHMEG_00040887 [Phytophthora megakarya]
MNAVGVLFDKLVELYPATRTYLSPNTNTVHSPTFARAIVKVAANREIELSLDETDILEPFKMISSSESATVPTGRCGGAQTRAQSEAEDVATAGLRSEPAPAESTP